MASALTALLFRIFSLLLSSLTLTPLVLYYDFMTFLWL